MLTTIIAFVGIGGFSAWAIWATLREARPGIVAVIRTFGGPRGALRDVAKGMGHGIALAALMILFALGFVEVFCG